MITQKRGDWREPSPSFEKGWDPGARGRTISVLVARRDFLWLPQKARGQLGLEWPRVQETWVQSLGWEDPLQKRMATHSSILAWRIPWTEEPGGL